MKKLTVATEYPLKSYVYLVTDPEQLQRQVSEISIDMNMGLKYLLKCSDFEPTWHYSGEMSLTKNVLLDNNMADGE
jgi:predicted P-loop ATPase/GTPase